MKYNKKEKAMIKAVNGKKKIVYARIASLLIEKDINQKEFSDALSELTAKPVTQANISLWATGRRNVPGKYLQPICEILGVSDAYLLGMTDDRNATFADVATETVTSKAEEGHNYEIEYAQLFAYDNCPVFIAFPNMQYEDAWSIYDRATSTFTFKDKTLSEKEMRSLGVKFYISDIRNLDDPLSHRKALDFQGMMNANDYIYVSMKSSDPVVHALYDGWYRHNEDHTALINEKAHVLPYTGYKVGYVAYAYRYKANLTED